MCQWNRLWSGTLDNHENLHPRIHYCPVVGCGTKGTVHFRRSTVVVSLPPQHIILSQISHRIFFRVDISKEKQPILYLSTLITQ